MYKNIEILNKEKFKLAKFENLKPSVVASNTGLIPIGFSEILPMNFFAPILIMGGEQKEFFAFTGISKTVNIFQENNTYIPKFIQTYPFLSSIVKKIDNKQKNVISIDNSQYIGENKQHPIFDQNGNFSPIANQKIEILKELIAQRDGSKKIIKEFEKYNLLIEKDFKLKYNDEEKTIIQSFYIIDRKKLTELDDEILALWARKGWMSIIDCHIKSLSNFHKVIQLTVCKN